MNCRTFHRNLEDYLEDGLDFPGRFGMERHAQQCIGCGKVLADAQRLGRMARELDRVQTPPCFEASVLEKIAKHKLNRRFSFIRRVWLFGFEPLSWRKLAWTSSCIAVLLLGFFYAFNHSSLRNSPHPSPSVETFMPQAAPPAIQAEDSETSAGNSSERGRENKAAHTRFGVKMASAPQPVDMGRQETFAEQEEADYIEYFMMGPDNRPVTIRLPLPKEIRMQYGQPSEEYFIRNVSH